MRTPLAVATVPLIFLSLAPAIAATSVPTVVINPQSRVLKPNVLPLALDERYQFRKTQEFVNDPKYAKPTQDAMVSFERERYYFGAITSLDHQEVRGNYYSFNWRTKMRGPVTVRFEYRQANLGAYVQAKEVAYNDAHGSIDTRFQVIGDDYMLDGRVTAWRALLISDGKIVGLTQSFLWD